MDAKQFIETNLKIIEVGAITSTLNLDGFLDQIKKTENDPPAGKLTEHQYSTAMQTMMKMKCLAESLKVFQVCFKESYGHLVQKEKEENVPNN